MNLTTAFTILRRTNFHVDNMLANGPAEPKWPRKGSTYWYHRYCELLKRVWFEFDADDFKVFGREAFVMALCFQPSHTEVEVEKKLYLEQEQWRLKFGRSNKKY